MSNWCRYNKSFVMSCLNGNPGINRIFIANYDDVISYVADGVTITDLICFDYPTGYTSGTSGTPSRPDTSGISGTSGTSGYMRSFFRVELLPEVGFAQDIPNILVGSATSVPTIKFKLIGVDVNTIQAFSQLKHGKFVVVWENMEGKFFVMGVQRGMYINSGTLGSDESTFEGMMVELTGREPIGMYCLSEGLDWCKYVVNETCRPWYGSSGTSGTSCYGSNGTSGTNGTSGSNGTSSFATFGSLGSLGSLASLGISSLGSLGSPGRLFYNGTSGTSGTGCLDGTSGTAGTSGTSGISLSGTTSLAIFTMVLNLMNIINLNTYDVTNDQVYTGDMVLQEQRFYKLYNDMVLKTSSFIYTPPPYTTSYYSAQIKLYNLTPYGFFSGATYQFGGSTEYEGMDISVVGDPLDCNFIITSQNINGTRQHQFAHYDRSNLTISFGNYYNDGVDISMFGRRFTDINYQLGVSLSGNTINFNTTYSDGNKLILVTGDTTTKSTNELIVNYSIQNQFDTLDYDQYCFMTTSTDSILRYYFINVSGTTVQYKTKYTQTTPTAAYNWNNELTQLTNTLWVSKFTHISGGASTRYINTINYTGSGTPTVVTTNVQSMIGNDSLITPVTQHENIIRIDETHFGVAYMMNVDPHGFDICFDVFYVNPSTLAITKIKTSSVWYGFPIVNSDYISVFRTDQPYP